MSHVEEGSPPDSMIERERELATLKAAVDRACDGRGGSVVIEGPGGIGKTSLLDCARRLGGERGMRTVSARGAELERSFPFGVVRQFFESFLFTVPGEERPQWLRGTEELAGRLFAGPAAGASEPAEEFAVLQSLYWMCVRIADERPLMMVLDDAQWADAPSLAFVEFTLRRLEQLPFLFVVATRPPDERSPAPLFALPAEPSAELLAPAALSAQAVARLVRERIDPRADDAFAGACHEVTNGNPFLLRELLHEIRDEELPANALSAQRVRALGPPGVARVVLLRLGRLPDGARRLAATLSVAADGMTLRELARLADLGEAEAEAAAAGLETAEIIDLRDGVRFVHPVLRTAVYEDLPILERARLHERAARLKAEQGRPPEEIASHLLHVEPGEDPWVLAILRQAASRASAMGDFADAQRLLERALRERDGEEEHAQLLAELGGAQARTGDPDGPSHLRQAADAIPDPELSAEISIELAAVLKFSLDADRAADVLLGAIGRLEDSSGELRRRLQAELIGTRFISPVSHRRVDPELTSIARPDGEPRDLLDAFLLAGAAYDAVAELRPAAEAIELGRRALAGSWVPNDPATGGQALVVASVALIWAEDFEFVLRRYTRALADARAAGSALAVGNNSAMRAMCSYRAGLLLQAEADAAAVLELAPQVDGLQTLLPPAVAHAVLCGIDRGVDLRELRPLAFDAALDAGSRMLPFTQLSWARGELCLALEDWEGALTHFSDCDREDPGYGAGNPAMVPWREGSALAHARLGESDRARELAAEAVRRARRFGAPRALGVALRARALVQEGDARIEGLVEAVSVLAEAARPLELARARCDLGAALRAAGKRSDARQALEEAYRLADSLGALRIARRAAAELGAAGVRPRREPGSGVGALTPSERRVAELAASGRTNREIAQALFVTEKTVETHLGHVYDKLGVRSRRKLSGLLDAPALAA